MYKFVIGVIIFSCIVSTKAIVNDEKSQTIINSMDD